MERTIGPLKVVESLSQICGDGMLSNSYKDVTVMLLSVNMSLAFAMLFISHSIFHLSLYLSIHPSSLTRSLSRLFTNRGAQLIATDSKPSQSFFWRGIPGISATLL